MIFSRLLDMLSSVKRRAFSRFEEKNPWYVPLETQIRGIMTSDPNYFAWLVNNKLREPAGLARERCTLRLSGPAPRFSVVMPVYNTEPRWLEKAVGSVLSQTYGNWELVICDDASTDPSTLSLLSRMKKSSGKIKVVTNRENRGISRSTNRGVEAASGDFVVLLDHDDELYFDALTKLYLSTLENPGANVFYSDEDRTSPEGYRYRHNFKPGFSPALLETHNYILHLVCVKRELFRSVGMMREGFDGSQDYDFLLRLMGAGESFVHVPDVLYSWRECSTSMVGGMLKPEVFLSGKKALKEYLEKRAGLPLIEVGDCPKNPMGFYKPVFEIPDGTRVLVVGPEQPLSSFGPVVVDTVSKEPGQSPVEAAKEALDGHDAVVFLGRGVVPESMEGFIEEMIVQVKGMGAGIAGGMLISGEGRVVHAGRTLVRDQALRYDYRDFDASGDFLFTRLRDTLAVSGAAMALAGSTLEEMGSAAWLSEEYWDVELCFRAREKGLRTVYTPFASAAVTEGTPFEDLPVGRILDLMERYRVFDDPFLNSNLSPGAKESGRRDFSLPRQLPENDYRGWYVETGRSPHF